MSVATVETFSSANQSGNEVLFAQRYDETGSKIGEAIQVTSDDISSYARSTLLLSNGGFVVAYDFVDPNDAVHPYPFAFLETREFSPAGDLLATNLIGQDDMNKTAGIESVALADGAYASIVSRSEGYANGGTLTETLQFTNAAGQSTETPLFTQSTTDVPYPQLYFSDPILKVLGNGNYSVSYSATYSEGSPEYPPPNPYPTGSEQFQQIYRSDSSLLTRTFVDFNHANDLYETTATAKLPQGFFNMTLLGSDRISGTGNALDNILIGNSNKNHLVGLDGNDRIDGKLGADYLMGGAGHDTFVFDTTIMGVFNSDLVADFMHGEDTIELSSKIFVGLAPGALASTAFVDLSTGSVGAATRIIYDGAGNLSYDPDGSGSAPAYQFATLAGHPTLTADDFLVV